MSFGWKVRHSAQYKCEPPVARSTLLWLMLESRTPPICGRALMLATLTTRRRSQEMNEVSCEDLFRPVLAIRFERVP